MLKQHSAGAVLLTTLNSWRYISALSLLAFLTLLLLVLFHLAQPVRLVVGITLLLLTQFFCWRIWLDVKLFAKLYQPDTNEAAFDKALQTLWNKNSEPRSIESRWAGAKKQLGYAVFSLFMLWVHVIHVIITA